MTDIEIVRLKTSDKSNLQREKFVGDGYRTNYVLKFQNILASPAMRVFINNTLTSDYTIDLINGLLIFNNAPVVGANIEVDYFCATYSDAEIQVFLDEAGGNTDLAAVRNLLSWAASQARLAMRETLSGGAGVGQVTRDTSVVAKELREAAKALKELYDTGQTSADYQSEGLTEVAWNDFSLRTIAEQAIIREL